MNGAERRGKRRLEGAIDQRRLIRHQRGKVLIADLARQQQQHQNAEREGSAQTARRPAGRRNHSFAYPDPVRYKRSSRRQKAP